MTMSGNLSNLAHDWFKSGDHLLDMIELGFVGPLQSRFSEKDRKERNKNSQKIESIQQNVLFVPKGLLGILFSIKDQCNADSWKKIARIEEKQKKDRK